MILKMMGREVDTSLFKKRKGFRFIVIDGEPFQFNWTSNHDLIMYDINQTKYTIPYEMWRTSDDSDEYKTTGLPRTWHGKHKKGACFGGWGKAEAAEMFRKYQKQLDKESKQ
jgi:hypothetical protein